MDQALQTAVVYSVPSCGEEAEATQARILGSLQQSSMQQTSRTITSGFG